MRDPPTGTVTFLFTDIEGSTRRWQDEPDAMRALLVEHDAILRDVIDKHRGHLFKHTGDGVAAVFASAADAVSAAVDAQARLADVLPVRMGLHTGEAELRDGDYFGSTLNRCARLVGVAHGGQIVCSAATIELVRDRNDLRDLGEHRLRDLSRAERLWQVGGGEFAALRSLDADRTNLPLQVTSFVGRDDDVVSVVELLAHSSLVTLVGVGGVGKTRLALQVGAELAPRYGDGVWLCELAPIDTAEGMAQVAALALGVQQRQGMSMDASIADYLRTRQLLLVLDNCEHVLAAAGDLVERILASCPKVRVLCTSREPLAVRGEQVTPVRSLGSASVDSPAVELFVDRARAVRPGFALGSANALAVEEVCRRLDGIPLAIELAASRVSAMSPQELASHLDERFRLLTGARRASLERHRTLRATVDWSYQLLDERDRFVFDRLGVFAGGFTMDTAQAVLGDDALPEWEVFDAVVSLVGKSMVVADEAADGATRYRMLETLRQYALDRLDEGGVTDEWRFRHAQHFASFVERLGPALFGPGEDRAVAMVIADIENLRSAVMWAADTDDGDRSRCGLRIAAELSAQVSFRAEVGVGAMCETLVARARECEPELRVAVVGGAAFASMQQGDLDRAIELGTAAIGDGRFGDGPPRVAAFAALALADFFQGQVAEGIEWLEAGLRTAVVPVDECQESVTLASIVSTMGEHDRALAFARRGDAVARASGSGTLQGMSSVVLGQVLGFREPSSVAAVDNLRRGVSLLQSGGAETMRGWGLAMLARILARQNLIDEAARLGLQALRHVYDVGDRTQLVTALDQMCPLVNSACPPDQVATFIGVIESGRIAARTQVDLIATERARVRGEVLTAIGPDVFEAAYDAGAAMDYDDAIAYALDLLGRIVAESAS